MFKARYLSLKSSVILCKNLQQKKRGYVRTCFINSVQSRNVTKNTFVLISALCGHGLDDWPDAKNYFYD